MKGEGSGCRRRGRGCFGSRRCRLWRGWMGFVRSMSRDSLRGTELIALLLPWRIFSAEREKDSVLESGFSREFGGGF